VHDSITNLRMLQKTQAVRSLQEGCSRLGLPDSTATALLQFLSVKRTHDQFVPEKDRQLSMSPGATLDKLWHYMLLNTTGTFYCQGSLMLVGCASFGMQLWHASHDISPQCIAHHDDVTINSMFPAAVSSCVHGLLGGVVEHRGTDAWDLADDSKLLQRLYALNILRLEGHDPDVELWMVRQQHHIASYQQQPAAVSKWTLS
jgi:hypothetical protein